MGEGKTSFFPYIYHHLSLNYIDSKREDETFNKKLLRVNAGLNEKKRRGGLLWIFSSAEIRVDVSEESVDEVRIRVAWIVPHINRIKCLWQLQPLDMLVGEKPIQAVAMDRVGSVDTVPAGPGNGYRTC